MFIFHFNYVFVFKFFNKLAFAVADPKIVTALRIFHTFDLAGLYQLQCAGNSRQNHYLSRGRGVLAVCGRDSSGGFLLVNKLVIPGKITIYPIEGECWQSADKILLVDSSSMSW
jgi:hypothetical protein